MVKRGEDRPPLPPDRLAAVLWVAGALAIGIALVRGRPLRPALDATAEPFATLGLVVAASWVALRLGVFDRLSDRALRSTSSRTVIVVALLGWVVLLSGLVNLDVAVVVVMPLALGLAGPLVLDAGLLIIAVANTANAASILLPTSNLTTLLVLGGAHGSAAFLAGSWIAWLGVGAVSIGAWTWLVRRRAGEPSGKAPAALGSATSWSLGRIAADLGAMFLIAVGLRALLPAGVTLSGGFAHQAATGSVFAAVVNNLPAASVVHPGPGGAWPAILAMAIGPNLLLTGSVATVICRRLARENGSELSLLGFTLAGLILVPIHLAVAYIGLHITGAV